MAFELLTATITGQAILRALAGPTPPTAAPTIAVAAGRPTKNIGRELEHLRNAGLICVENALTDEGRAQLAALDRAGDPAAAGAPSATHADIGPSELNPRKDFETSEAEQDLDDLRQNIISKGVLQPILVRPGRTEGGPSWEIIDGERRWRAVGQAISDGDWPADRPIRIEIREVSDGEHLELSLTANIQRANMSAIEEGVALVRAVSEFGTDTDELATRLGKSRRWVQMRMQLTELPEVDQDRMRLPRGHPDRLGFKAAMALLQTPREGTVFVGIDLASGPDLVSEVEVSRGADGTLRYKIAGGEPGSPAPGGVGSGGPEGPTTAAQKDAPSFGSTLTDREALLLVEICDKSERDPDPDLGSEGYTRVQNVPVTGAAAGLVGKNAIGFRQRGPNVFVTPRLHSTGAGAWLTEIGFYEHRDDVLFEFRARVIGGEAAAELSVATPPDPISPRNYATEWLNPADPAAAETQPAPRHSDDDDGDPHQPDLIEPSPEEAMRIAEARRDGERKEWARSIVRMMARETLALIDNPAFSIPTLAEGPKRLHSGHHRQFTIATLLGAVRAQDPRLAMLFLGYTFAYSTHTGRLEGFRRLEPDERDQLEGRILPQGLAPDAGDSSAVGALRGLERAAAAFMFEHIQKTGSEPTGEAYRALRDASRAAHLICAPDKYSGVEAGAIS